MPQVSRLEECGSSKAKKARKGELEPKQSKGREVDLSIGEVMKMIDTITSYLVNFTLRFENRNSSTQSSKDITPNARAVWVKKGTYA